jgi:hypothetical protein
MALLKVYLLLILLLRIILLQATKKCFLILSILPFRRVGDLIAISVINADLGI